MNSSPCFVRTPAPRPPHWMALAWLCASVCMGFAPSAAHAADEVDGAALAASALRAVTVYPGMAMVERSVRVPAGASRIAVACLPADVDVRSLQMQAPPDLRLGAPTLQTRARAELPACREGAEDARIRSLQEQLAGLTAEYDSQSAVLAYLKNAAPPSAAAPQAGSALTANAQSLRRVALEALSAQARLAREREALNAELKPLLEERDRMRSPNQRISVLTLAVSAAGGRDAQFTLRYPVNGPTWGPAYRAVLDDAQRTVSVERIAQVVQNTGEDWKDVALTLSTGRPLAGAQAPEPQPWELEVAERARPRYAAAPAITLSAMPAPAPTLTSVDAAREAAFEPIQTVESTYATEFAVPGQTTLPSGRTATRLTLGRESWPVKVMARIVAPHPQAFVVAEVARPSGIWPAGPMELLRGAQAAGRTQWEMGEQSTLTLPFGVDERVRVQIDPDQARSGTAGFIGSSRERQVTQTVVAENRHAQAMGVQLLMATPSASDERIKITQRFAPEPTARHWQEMPGVVLWEQTLKAGETAKWSATSQVSHDKDLPVEGWR